MDVQNVFNRKFLTGLTQAKYVTVGDKDPKAYQHYGLNFPLYTHFTSPIRRYADLLVHRLLTISLKEQEKTRELIEDIDYEAYAEMCSEKSYNARRAGQDCQRLFHCLLLKQKGPQALEAIVFDLDMHSVSVYIPEINLHYILKLKDDPRIERTELFDSETEFVVAGSLTKGVPSGPGVRNYTQRRQKEEAKEGTTIDNVCFGIFDKVMLKVDTTEEFPLDLKCSLMISADDFQQAAALQEQEQAAN